MLKTKAKAQNNCFLPPSRRRRHGRRVSPSHEDCAECRAIAVLAAQGYPTMCNCEECRNMRTAYPNRTPYCNCQECRNTRRAH